MDYTRDPNQFDALPPHFIARVNVGAQGAPLYALFEQRGQVFNEQNYMYVNVITPIAPGYSFGTSSMFSPVKCSMRSHTRKHDEPIATVRDCIYETEGIEVAVYNAPIRGAQLISFRGREAEILPPVPNNAVFALRISREYTPRRYEEAILPMWRPPVAQPIAAPIPAARELPVAVVAELPPLRARARTPSPPRAGYGYIMPADEENDAPAATPMGAGAHGGLPAHVKTILIEAAIAKGESCPISLNAITKENAAVTSCGHVFDRDSIAQWLASSDRHGCAVCREHCVV